MLKSSNLRKNSTKKNFKAKNETLSAEKKEQFVVEVDKNAKDPDFIAVKKLSTGLVKVAFYV